MSPGTPNLAVVRRHLLALDEAVKHLRTHAQCSLDELARDPDKMWTVERGLQICSQNCLDIATHIVASAGIDAPDYASAIDALGRQGILPRAFVTQFRKIAGFRNILVHAYLDVDIGQLHQLLCHRLDDFRSFAEHIQAYLDSVSG